ncbi:hypothetical protein BsWGS_19182 [Bradybaena similaris]
MKFALLTRTKEDIQVKTENVSRMTKSFGLEIKVNKSKIMRIKARNQWQVKIDKRGVEEVDEFRYLASCISKDGLIEILLSSKNSHILRMENDSLPQQAFMYQKASGDEEDQEKHYREPS